MKTPVANRKASKAGKQAHRGPPAQLSASLQAVDPGNKTRQEPGRAAQPEMNK